MSSDDEYSDDLALDDEEQPVDNNNPDNDIIPEDVDDIVEEPKPNNKEELYAELEEEDPDAIAEVAAPLPDDLEVDYIANEAAENQLHRNIIVIDPKLRRTSNMLTEYELTGIITTRAAQIETHATVLTNVDGLDDAEAMAWKEFRDKRCPLVLQRKVGERVIDGKLTEYYEYFDVNDMRMP